MALLCHVNIKKELKFLASELQKETLPTFYTDGSVKFIGNTRCLNGYGWIQCQPNTPQVSFKGSTVFFPSTTFNTLLHSPIISPRRKLKQN
ncbi:hypothetical protein RIR_jg4780.t1 [Rhizophagus irregularis DAOM 181602=DAOM 197198]|nr:hypothetical protein RIR_jg4780.t1 [Rhizophagus irregularis DAOM 181602=DAOM 197198]